MRVCRTRTWIPYRALFENSLCCLKRHDQADAQNAVLKVQVSQISSSQSSSVRMILFLHLNKLILLRTRWNVIPELSGKAVREVWNWVQMIIVTAFSCSSFLSVDEPTVLCCSLVLYWTFSMLLSCLALFYWIGCTLASICITYECLMYVKCV